MSRPMSIPMSTIHGNKISNFTIARSNSHYSIIIFTPYKGKFQKFKFQKFKFQKFQKFKFQKFKFQKFKFQNFKSFKSSKSQKFKALKVSNQNQNQNQNQKKKQTFLYRGVNMIIEKQRSNMGTWDE